MRSQSRRVEQTTPVTALPTVRVWLPVRVANYRAGARFGPRTLPDFQLLWMLAGSVRRSVDDPGAIGAMAGGAAERHLELRPGALSLGRPGLTETYDWDPVVHSSHAYLHFVVDDLAGLPPVEQWPETQDMARTPVLAGLCQYLLELGTVPGTGALRRTEHCLALLLDVFLRGPWGDQPAATTWLEPMIRMIGVRWAENGVQAVPVDELANAMGMSRGHLTHLVSQHHGCGPARLVELVRLARAAVLLQAAVGVGQVATRIGYANPYHFSRRFTRAYGVAPSRFGRGSADPYGPLRSHGLLSVTRRLLQATNPS